MVRIDPLVPLLTEYTASIKDCFQGDVIPNLYYGTLTGKKDKDGYNRIILETARDAWNKSNKMFPASIDLTEVNRVLKRFYSAERDLREGDVIKWDLSDRSFRGFGTNLSQGDDGSYRIWVKAPYNYRLTKPTERKKKEFAGYCQEVLNLFRQRLIAPIDELIIDNPYSYEATFTANIHLAEDLVIPVAKLKFSPWDFEFPRKFAGATPTGIFSICAYPNEFPLMQEPGTMEQHMMGRKPITCLWLPEINNLPSMREDIIYQSEIAWSGIGLPTYGSLRVDCLRGAVWFYAYDPNTKTVAKPVDVTAKAAQLMSVLFGYLGTLGITPKRGDSESSPGIPGFVIQRYPAQGPNVKYGEVRRLPDVHGEYGAIIQLEGRKSHMPK